MHADLLIEHHHSYLAALARRLCRTVLDPDDLLQDVFEKTARASRPIPEGVNERAWLSRVLHNLFIDTLRRRRARAEEPLDPALELPIEDGPWWQRLTMDQIRAMLDKLPEAQRATFELFAFEGLSYEEIAVAQGIAKATVGTRILRARSRLRELLTVEHDEL
jgi:RNA polymerase sigma-70 factor (ECF subfamily)